MPRGSGYTTLEQHYRLAADRRPLYITATTARASCSGIADADAARFVNDFQHVMSADTYWFTDPNI